jgi:hypothetical protein
MKSSPFTKAHLRALEFLPADGSWLVDPPFLRLPLLIYLDSDHPGLVITEKGSFAPSTKTCTRWRLTPAGIAAKAAQNASAA